MINFEEGDIESITSLAKQVAMPHVKRDFEENGENDLIQLNRIIREIYKYVAPETIDELLVLNCSLDSKDLNFSNSGTTPIEINRISSLTEVELSGATIQIVRNDLILLYQDEIVDIELTREKSIIYHFKYGNEKYILRTDEVVIPSPSTFPSYFAIPTYKTLDTALESYYNKRAKSSNCPLLKDSWFDVDRIFFKQKPESYHRTSLYRFLDITLRAEVSEEQNVDDTQPVDIKVSWNFTNHLALIEIKWLGKSIKEDRSSFTSIYNNARAQEGYNQIINYMDIGKDRFFDKQSIGYLVVFDGRRYQTGLDTTVISQQNGFHYQSEEPTYDPDPNSLQNIKPPVRFFMEPICNG